jgi:hypothetical protein
MTIIVASKGPSLRAREVRAAAAVIGAPSSFMLHPSSFILLWIAAESKDEGGRMKHEATLLTLRKHAFRR